MVQKLGPVTTALVYSTYLGGSCANGDVGNGIAIDSQANPYLAGDTCSSDFPTYPSGAYQTSLAGTQNAFVTKFALNPNPGITASVSPPPDASGWNNSAVTVSFTCTPGGAPISSCSSPATVSTEGANQVVSGTATDTASNSSSTSVTVNLDMTPPSLSISSPSSGSSVSTPYVTLTGSVSDSLSGVGPIGCNGVTATHSAGSFSCLVQLSFPSNVITVTATDLAGNAASSSVTVNISMATPTSIQVTPSPVTVVIGNTQSFAAVDQGGTRRPDATWSVSDTSVATLASDGSGTITAVAAGTVTLTATVGSASGQSTVTVVSGSLTAGAVLWTAPVVSGFTTQKIVQAVPTTNGPDLYAIDADSNGDLLIRAFRSDGEQLWQNEINLASLGIYNFQQALGDNTGGILIGGSGSNSGNPFGAILDVNGQTGNQAWQYSSSGYSSLNGDAAVGLDGTVYIVEEDLATNAGGQSVSYGYLDVINGATGALLNQVKLPYAYTYVNCVDYSQPSIAYNPGAYGPSMVGPDGSVYLEAVGYQSIRNGGCEIGPPATYSYTDTLSLFQMQSGGSPQLQTLVSISTSDGTEPASVPGNVIPDGQGGVLANWYSASASNWVLADIGSTGTTQATFSTGVSSSDSGMVLGDNGIAFTTDGTNVIAFNATTLQTLWTYSSQDYISFTSATRGGGVAIEDSQQGLIQFDSNGNASSPVPGFSNWGPWALSVWPMISNSELAFVYGPDVVVADADFPEPQANGARNRQFKKPTIANFIPVGTSDLGMPPQDAFTDIAANTNQSAFYESFPIPNSTTTNFKKELAKPISALGFIGHSLDIQQTPAPNASFFSIGLVLWDTNLVRTPEPGDNPDYSQFVQPTDDKEKHLPTQASVLFFGTCYVGPYFTDLWTIDGNTKGQAMIVPSNPSQTALLGHSVYAWSNILRDMMTSGMNVGDAVRQTNSYLATQKDINGRNISERWRVVGDPSVKINQ